MDDDLAKIFEDYQLVKEVFDVISVKYDTRTIHI